MQAPSPAHHPTLFPGFAQPIHPMAPFARGVYLHVHTLSIALQDPPTPQLPRPSPPPESPVPPEAESLAATGKQTVLPLSLPVPIPAHPTSRERGGGVGLVPADQPPFVGSEPGSQARRGRESLRVARNNHGGFEREEGCPGRELGVAWLLSRVRPASHEQTPYLALAAACQTALRVTRDESTPPWRGPCSSGGNVGMVGMSMLRKVQSAPAHRQ